MPVNEVIKQIKILEDDGTYSLKNIGADASNINVIYGGNTDVQSAIDSLDLRISDAQQAEWNGEGRSAILNQDEVYAEQHKFGTGYGLAQVPASGSMCTVDIPDFRLQAHAIVVVKFDRDIAAGHTLNINSTGARIIYYQDVPVPADTVHAGDTVTLIYDPDATTYPTDGAFRIISVDTGTGNTKFEPDMHDFVYNGSDGHLSLMRPIFKGTTQEWEDLAQVDKDHYDGGIVNLIDEDENALSDLTNKVELGNMDAVTSNGVAVKFNEMAAELTENVETSNIAENAYEIGDYVHYVNDEGTFKFARVDTAIDVGDTISENVTNTNIGGTLTDMLKMAYPVGSIYMSVNSTDPGVLFPGTTWEAWGTGRVPVGVDANDTDFDEAEATGGEKEHTLLEGEMPRHTHTFTGTTNQSVNNTNLNHRHYNNFTSGGGGSFSSTFQAVQHPGAHAGNIPGGGGSLFDVSQVDITVSAGNHTHAVQGWGSFVNNSASTAAWNHSHTFTATGTNSYAGEDTAHNNLQPYITCYMWKRVS